MKNSPGTSGLHAPETFVRARRVFLFMAMARLAAAYLLLSALAFGQAKGTGVVAGMVLEASNGDPVRKAVVTLTLQAAAPPTWATARTDSAGRFRFEGLPAGKYTLRAAKNGLGTAVYGANSTRDTGDLIALGAGDIREGLTMRFRRAATVSGRIVDTDGDPIPGVSVMLLHPTRNLGERVLSNYRGSVTDDHGEYRIAAVDAGQYYLLASPQNNRNSVNGVRAAQYYGGARESKDSRLLNIRSGQTLTGFDFLINQEPGFHIHGHLAGVPDLGSSGPPPPAAGSFTPMYRRANQIEVRLNSVGEIAQRASLATTTGPPEYEFEFNDVVRGLYRVEAIARSGDKTWAASREIDSSQASAEITLPMAPAADIEGTVKIEGRTEPAGTNPRITLVRQGRNENFTAGPDADGHFTFKQVTPGEWSLNINNIPSGSFLKSASLGDRDVRFTRFAIESGQQPPLNITLSFRTAKLEGSIDIGNVGSLDSRRAGIVLAPVGAFHSLARFDYGGVADDEGKFHLENLAPGKYRMFALEKTLPADFRNPEAADQLADLGEEIELTEGGTLQVHPKLIPAARAREALPEGIR